MGRAPSSVTGALVLVALSSVGCRAESGDRTMVDGPAPTRSAVEIRVYNLVPGSRPEFHRLVVEEGLPLLERWDVDVVAYGPSAHDENSYFLIRAFDSLEERQRVEDGFYGNAEWRDGPREQILALIESYATVVLELDAATVEALRGAAPRDLDRGAVTGP